MTSRSHVLNRRSLIGGVTATMLASTAVRPLGVAAQNATPAGATPAAQPASGGLASMLAKAPASFPWVDDPAEVTISYADIATQLAVTQPPPVDSADDPNVRLWVLATHMQAVPRPAAQYLKTWREDFGFDLLQADETLAVSQPPFDLSLFRGRFDHDAIRAALANSGYREVDVDGATLYSLRDDTSPVADEMAAMNHGVIMDDGTLVFSSARAAVEDVLDVAAGAASALNEQPGLALLAEHAPADLVTVTIADGAMLTGYTPIPGVTEMPVGELPPVTTVLAGVTAGGVIPGANGGLSPDTPGARAVAMAVLETSEAAEAAVPVVEERLETGTSALDGSPLSRYVAASTVAAVEGAPVLVIDITVSENATPMILVQMLNNHDLSILAW